MVYFDNAATGGFKPKCVTDSVYEALRRPANPGRASHKLALGALQTVSDARSSLLTLFGCADDAQAVFTKNCTEALNLALFGTLKEGGHVISSVLEHNSVLRPLCALESEKLISFSLAVPGGNGKITAAEVEKLIRPDTYAVALTAASNVTGSGAELAEIGRLAREKGLLFIVDGAQAAGHTDLNLPLLGIDVLCVPGHKGLLGPGGTGAIIFSEGVQVSPVMFGGTGTESENTCQPAIYPESLESGTLNLAGIAGLKAGVDYIIRHRTVLKSKLELLGKTLLAGLKSLSEVNLFGASVETGIFSFLLGGENSTDTADTLGGKYDIAVRSGLHCAPLAHRHLGTLTSGLVRVSLSPFNTLSEMNYLLNVLEEIA